MRVLVAAARAWTDLAPRDGGERARADRRAIGWAMNVCQPADQSWLRPLLARPERVPGHRRERAVRGAGRHELERQREARGDEHRDDEAVGPSSGASARAWRARTSEPEGAAEHRPARSRCEQRDERQRQEAEGEHRCQRRHGLEQQVGRDHQALCALDPECDHVLLWRGRNGRSRPSTLPNLRRTRRPLSASMISVRTGTARCPRAHTEHDPGDEQASGC